MTRSIINSRTSHIFPNDDAVTVIVAEDHREARRLMNHLFTKGWWFVHRHREGDTEFIFSTAVNLTRLGEKFKFRLA